MSDVDDDPPSEQPPVAAAAPSAGRPGLLSASNPWLPVLVGVGVTFVACLTWIQWWRPYIEHDDWDMLLPNGPAFVENHSLRLLYEGRWLNHWWWALGSQDLSPRGAAILYAIAWLIVVAVVVRSFSIRWWSVPAVTALYAAPMMSMLSYWPATLAAPMWVLALTVSLLWITRERWALHLAILAVGTIVIALGYPPLALLLLAFLVGLHHGRSWSQLTVLAATFASAYVVGILVVFTLNDLRFGMFGLEIQSWRHPSALNSLSSLSHHLQTVGRTWGAVVRPATLPLIAGLAALIAVLAEARWRRRMLVLVLALIAGAGLSASSTILNGVDVPARAMGWIWPFLVLIAVWGLDALHSRVRVVGAAALAFVAVWSGLYAAYGTLGHQGDQNGLNALRSAVVAQYRENPGTPIIFAVRHRHPTPSERQAVWQVGDAMAKFDGIGNVSVCRGCRLISTQIDAGHPQTWVFTTGDAIVVQLPESMDDSGLHAEPEPRWLVPWR